MKFLKRFQRFLIDSFSCTYPRNQIISSVSGDTNSRHVTSDNILISAHEPIWPTMIDIIKENEFNYGFCIMEVLSNMRLRESEHNYSEFNIYYREHRLSVIQWIADICSHFKLLQVTIHGAVAYLDRVQPDDSYSRFEWQLLALACVLISAKHCEMQDNLPAMSAMSQLTQTSLSNEEIMQYEMFIMLKLKWSMEAHTTAAFLSCFMFTNLVFAGDSIHIADDAGLPSDLAFLRDKREEGSQHPVGHRTADQTDAFSCIARFNSSRFRPRGCPTVIGAVHTQLDPACIGAAIRSRLDTAAMVCLMSDDFKPMKCSQVAASVVLYARRSIHILPEWCPELELLTGYSVSALTELSRLLESHIQGTITSNAVAYDRVSDDFDTQMRTPEKSDPSKLPTHTETSPDTVTEFGTF